MDGKALVSRIRQILVQRDPLEWPVADALIDGSAHTIAQTRDFLILADSGNFKSDLGELGGAPRTVRIDESAAVFIVAKSAFDAPPGTEVSAVRSAVAPTTGHFYAQYNDADGIQLIFEHMDLMDLGFRLQDGDLDANGTPIPAHRVGMYNMAMGPNTISEVRIDPHSGAAEQTAVFRADWTFNLQLSAIDWSTAGMTAPTLHHQVYQGWQPQGVTQRALEHYRAVGRIGKLPAAGGRSRLVTFRRDGLDIHAMYEFAEGDFASSPSFVPRSAGAGGDRYGNTNPGGHDGYVVVPVLADSGFRVEVFDAGRVGDGPVAVLVSAATVPVMLHSAWMPTPRALVDVPRLRFADEIDEVILQRIDLRTAATVREVAAALA